MGLLKNASVEDWEDAEKARAYIHKHGIIQFINVYKKYMDRCCDELKWGDEIECNLVVFDHEKKTVKVLQDAPFIIDEFAKRTIEKHLNFEVKPEYGSYMLELTPTKPYNHFACALNGIERNMRDRRIAISEFLKDNQHLLMIPHFPLLGKGDFAAVMGPLHGPNAVSDYVPDTVISPFPRFAALTRNIRKRRGEKVCINVPTFIDINTTLPSMIHMDAMVFGMGSCCLQVTFQCESVQESRILYDQLVVISPYVMAMTAYTPIFRGMLSDIDTRWSVISASVDDRRADEREGVYYIMCYDMKPHAIPKSRYDSVDLYINPDSAYDKYNDLNVPIDQESYDTLIANDALVSYDDYATKDDLDCSEHFENIQSSNWQSVRWKPPMFGGPVEAWRVELRTMEVMLTEYENAAFTVFAGLLCRSILFFNLELYIPMTKVEENMKRAEKRNALLEQKFWFSNCGVPNTDRSAMFHCTACECPNACAEYTILEILDGNKHFPGFIPLIRTYLDMIKCSPCTVQTVIGYLDFIRKRATGEILTGAAWMRQFVMSHPLYRHDSEVSEEIIYDMLLRMVKISDGEIQDKTLLGDVIISNEVTKMRPCVDTTVLIGKVFKAPESKLSVLDLIKEAEAFHASKN